METGNVTFKLAYAFANCTQQRNPAQLAEGIAKFCLVSLEDAAVMVQVIQGDWSKRRAGQSKRNGGSDG